MIYDNNNTKNKMLYLFIYFCMKNNLGSEIRFITIKLTMIRI